jgi:class 3 adenylate cyclase/tetratricopeptide (TPR) repeat protein
MMRCPNCSTELPDGAKFCLECGRDLRGRSEFASPAAYTPKHLAERILTSRAALSGERKQVTVLFCDLANSTSLAERVGPERMHALLNGFFELAMTEVHRYEGTINQFLGDGFMALFGAPLAHEDDARRAALAAFQIRRALKDRASYAGLGPGGELAVRMGLNTGLVVVGSIGDNLRMDYTAVGDTTNVAARLQQAAAPGDILISEATARLVRGEVRLLPTGALTVKGKSEPVSAYKILGLAPRQSAFEHAAERAYGRFVGRERELRRLGELLVRAQAGEGALVSVVGEAGAGKSRLLYEFRRSLGETDVTTLEARCRSHAATIPYLPVLDLVRGQCGLDERDPPDTVTGRVRATLAALGLDADDRAPYLLALLGIKEGAAAVGELPQEVVRARTVETLSRMLVAASRRRPLLVVVEDLHWVDAASEDFLRTLVGAIEDAPILLIGTHRSDWSPSWGTPECVTRIELPRLSEDESLALVADVVARTQLPPTLVHAILDRADGNPLFLEELSRAVAEQSASAQGLSVPDSLRAVLSARIDRLPDAPRQLLQTAAVLGREFPRTLLEATWDGPGSVAAHLAELARLDFLHEVHAGDDAVHAFNHALTQEVAYDGLLSGPRQALHEAAARALETDCADRKEREWDRLAYHWTRTTRADKAVEALRRVAARAMTSYAGAEAVAALREAETHAARLGADAERVTLEVALERAQAQFVMGQPGEVAADLEARAEAVTRLNDPSLTAQYHFRLAAVLGMLGRTRPAIDHAERALAEAERAGDDATAGKAHYALTRESFWSGDFQRGVEHGRQAIVRLERTGERWWLAMTNWMRALNYLELGRFDEALDSAAWVATLADKLGDPRLASYAAWVGGWAHSLRGEWETGIAAGRRAVELAPDELGRALAEAFLGIGYVEKEDAGAALPLLERAAATFERMQFPQLEGWLLFYQAQAHLLGGDRARATALVARGLEVVRGIRFAPAMVTARAVEAALARDRGDLDEAARLLGDALALCEQTDSRYAVGRVHLLLADVARARRDGDALGRHLAAAQGAFRAVGAPVWVARAEAAGRAAGVTPAAGV